MSRDPPPDQYLRLGPLPSLRALKHFIIFCYAYARLRGGLLHINYEFLPLRWLRTIDGFANGLVTRYRIDKNGNI